MNRMITLTGLSLVGIVAFLLVSCSPAQGSAAKAVPPLHTLFVKGTTYYVCCAGADALTDRGHDVTVIDYGPGSWIKIRVNEGRDQGTERWMNADQVVSMRCR